MYSTGWLQAACSRVGSAPVLWATHRGSGDPQHICTVLHTILYTSVWLLLYSLDTLIDSAFNSRPCCLTSSPRTTTRLRSPEEIAKPLSTEKQTAISTRDTCAQNERETLHIRFHFAMLPHVQAQSRNRCEIAFDHLYIIKQWHCVNSFNASMLLLVFFCFVFYILYSRKQGKNLLDATSLALD